MEMHKRKGQVLVILCVLLVWLGGQAWSAWAESGVTGSFTVTDPDELPPAAVIDLRVEDPTISSLTLRWTAPGNDGRQGRAARYEIRYALTPITTWEAWQVATPVPDPPIPGAAGTPEELVVGDLEPATTYHFALIACDRVGNCSDLSNDAWGTTLPSAGLTTHVIHIPLVLAGNTAPVGSAAKLSQRLSRLVSFPVPGGGLPLILKLP